MHALSRRPSDGEVRSWERSLTSLAFDLQLAGLDAVEVLLEHQLPLTSKRADASCAAATRAPERRRTSSSS